MESEKNDISKQSVGERLEILEQTAKTFDQIEANEEIPDWHMKILQERLQKYEGALTEGESWEEVKKGLSH